MNTILKRTLLSSLVLPFALGVQSASADMITDWDYQVNNTLTSVSESLGAGEVIASDANRKLSWGEISTAYPNQSSISITDVMGSGLQTNNTAYTTGGVFTHNNFKISNQDAALESFDLTSALTLTPTAPETGDSFGAASITFASFFKETKNNNGSCVPLSGSTCDDIFTVGNISALNPRVTDTGFEFTSSFNRDDYTYTVFLELAGIGALSNEACSAAGASTGCVGFLTEENAVNNYTTKFRIAGVETEVPEPGTMALLGLGLAGLGLSRRKKAAKS